VENAEREESSVLRWAIGEEITEETKGIGTEGMIDTDAAFWTGSVYTIEVM